MNAHKRNDKFFNNNIVEVKIAEIKALYRKQKHAFPLPLF